MYQEINNIHNFGPIDHTVCGNKLMKNVTKYLLGRVIFTKSYPKILIVKTLKAI